MGEDGRRRSFDRAFKEEAVCLVTYGGRRVSEVARELGINANQLHRWKRQLTEAGDSAFPGKGRMSSDQEELGRLRKENADLREERDILKGDWIRKGNSSPMPRLYPCVTKL
ncbi:MAG: transposase [candidate division Zixibacteria bacterium]|nr:transposase [Pseudomonadota bacterium]MBU2625962.1 transposase [candidate division Zixibacteria bacterium]